MTTTTVKAEKSPAEAFATPVQFLPGVGPKRVDLLAKLGLQTARDVIFFFPRDYQDLTDLRAIPDLEEGKLQSVVARVEEFEIRNTAPGRCIVGVLVEADRRYLRAVWFNQPWMIDKFTRGQTVLFSGQPKYMGGRWEMAHPQVQWLEADEEAPRGKLLPIYPLTEGLNQGQLRHIVRGALELCVDKLDEVFPEKYRTKHRLWPLVRALPQLHFPDDRPSLDAARRRLVYQELFVQQLALATKRQQAQQLGGAPSLACTAQIDARIRRLLPFQLTSGQEAVIGEITADLTRSIPMNRLLQGDVGSGKTAVAMYAILVAVAHRHQAVIMTPTEILARQHFGTFSRLLEKSQVRLGLLTGTLSSAQRRDIDQRIAKGEVDLVVGTQALVRGEAQFSRLGLVVIDEQHKFGVRQRALLKSAGQNPHYLVMTATPIPRTVAMTQYGDLDVSILSEMPPGRQKVNTYLVRPGERAKWWDFFRRKLGEGRQGFIVTPLVDESDDMQIRGVEEVFESLVNGELAEFRVGLVHGRLPPDEKEAAMETFRQGERQVIVATNVVEVGVDVPNATLMMIENAERFGLAQLHQLRGRVSRGKFPGYCGIFADPQTEEATARLEAFVESTDGFHLAEVDFQLRGPGDLLGTRQHGLAPLRIADLNRDKKLLAEARHDAQAMVADDPALSDPDHAALRGQMLRRYGSSLDLGDVG